MNNPLQANRVRTRASRKTGGDDSNKENNPSLPESYPQRKPGTENNDSGRPHKLPKTGNSRQGRTDNPGSVSKVIKKPSKGAPLSDFYNLAKSTSTSSSSSNSTTTTLSSDHFIDPLSSAPPRDPIAHQPAQNTSRAPLGDISGQHGVVSDPTRSHRYHQEAVTATTTTTTFAPLSTTTSHIPQNPPAAATRDENEAMHQLTRESEDMTLQPHVGEEPSTQTYTTLANLRYSAEPVDLTSRSASANSAPGLIDTAMAEADPEPAELSATQPVPASSTIANIQAPQGHLLMAEDSMSPESEGNDQEEAQPMAPANPIQDPAQEVAPLPLAALGILDIDAELAHDPQTAAEYAVEIYSHLHAVQISIMPSPHYMTTIQSDITPSMRAILIDWLVEVAQEYNLTSNTFFLSVSLIDRFLSKKAVQRGVLQLVGLTCTLIAAKYEEIYAPAINELVYISDSTYTRNQILDMEIIILRTLNFFITGVTPKQFLRRFLRAAEADAVITMLANYLVELTAQDYNFLEFQPSEIAASGVYLALRTLRVPDWNATLEHYTGYSLPDLQTCVFRMHAVHVSAPHAHLQAVRDKYSAERFLSVALVRPVGAAEL